MTRQLVLDTETTGLEPKEGHRIIEIGCVELLNRRLTGNNYHVYINPEREIDQGAIEVHGITNEFLADKPKFSQIAKEFKQYIDGAELVIHNAPFDVGFINHEFGMINLKTVADYCSVVDTLKMARKMHPGQRNSLDALCKRYFVDNSSRDLHGALLDAEILADVYLAMTGGQVNLFAESSSNADQQKKTVDHQTIEASNLMVIQSTPEELAQHQAYLAAMQEKGACLWLDELE